MNQYLSFSVRYRSEMEPPTRLILTDDPPPPINRVTIMVAKFCAKADGKRKMMKMM
jgi:hypothetical protein